MIPLRVSTQLPPGLLEGPPSQQPRPALLGLCPRLFTAQLPAGDTPPPSIDRNRDEDGTQRRMAGPTGESQPGLPPPGTTSQRAFIWAPHCAGGKSQSPGLSGWNFRWSPSRP